MYLQIYNYNKPTEMSRHFQPIPMYEYAYQHFAMICGNHLTMDNNEDIMTDNEIDHYVSLMDLGKEKKKMARKMLIEMRCADPPTCRDERVFVEIFKLLLRELKEYWCSHSIESYYHKQLELYTELTKEGKKTEQELINAANNIKQQMEHVKDELLDTCMCGDMLVSFHKDKFRIVILPCKSTFK